MKGKRIGFAVTGSHCTLAQITKPMGELVEAGNTVFPIISPSVATENTRFGTASHWRATFEQITGNKVIDSIPAAEPIGPKMNLDIVIVAPCTGNTMAKLANAITDTSVTMAVKAQLRNRKPVVLAIATNDALGGNAKNLGVLLDKKYMYFVPFRQDNPHGKPCSVVSDMGKIIEATEAALASVQLQPLLLGSE
jgi:dipicolinate synthase subunit B